jgi:hypothetical protein
MRIIFDLMRYVCHRAKRAVNNFWRDFQSWRKENIIARALETDEGRAALAQSMVEPIRRALEYQGIGRKLLMVDDLPEGALPQYHENGLQKHPIEMTEIGE